MHELVRAESGHAAEGGGLDRRRRRAGRRPAGRAARGRPAATAPAVARPSFAAGSRPSANVRPGLPAPRRFGYNPCAHNSPGPERPTPHAELLAGARARHAVLAPACSIVLRRPGRGPTLAGQPVQHLPGPHHPVRGQAEPAKLGGRRDQEGRRRRGQPAAVEGSEGRPRYSRFPERSSTAPARVPGPPAAVGHHPGGNQRAGAARGQLAGRQAPLARVLRHPPPAGRSVRAVRLDHGLPAAGRRPQGGVRVLAGGAGRRHHQPDGVRPPQPLLPAGHPPGRAAGAADRHRRPHVTGDERPRTGRHRDENPARQDGGRASAGGRLSARGVPHLLATDPAVPTAGGSDGRAHGPHLPTDEEGQPQGAGADERAVPGGPRDVRRHPGGQGFHHRTGRAAAVPTGQRGLRPAVDAGAAAGRGHRPAGGDAGHRGRRAGPPGRGVPGVEQGQPASSSAGSSSS